MTATIQHRAPLPGQTNERVELARYTITAGERVIYGQRIRGVVRLVDVPAEGRSRRFLIERELTSLGELQAIVAGGLPRPGRPLGCDPRRRPLLPDPSDRRGAGPMTDRRHSNRAERHQLTEQDLAIATLVGRYVEHREQGVPPRVHDLLALAAEFGDAAVDDLRTVLAFYEAMRASDALGL